MESINWRHGELKCFTAEKGTAAASSYDARSEVTEVQADMAANSGTGPRFDGVWIRKS